MTLTNAVCKELTYTDVFNLIKENKMTYSEFVYYMREKQDEYFSLGYREAEYDHNYCTGSLGYE